ncbi:sugar ABC transporter substrate-binding protein [Ktedonobacter sp. SOSP1-52]|nr:sugar ABC transporter substrate-binding protein [Ktedonobacter sp. SOSP1-52]
MNNQTRMSRRDVLKLGMVTAATASLTLAGCGSSTDAATPSGTLSIMTWGSDKRLKQSFQAVSSTYPKDFSGIKLNVIVAGSGDADVTQAFRLALAAHKNIPDIVRLNYTELIEFAQAGVIDDLSDLINPVKDDLYIGAQKLATYQGKFVAVPEQVKSKMFYYRTDLFEQAHLTPDDLATVDGLIAAGQKFHARNAQAFMLNMGPQPSGAWIGEIMSAYPNPRTADSSGHYIVSSNPAFADAFTFVKRLHDSGITLPVDDFSPDWGPAFKNQRIGAALHANWLKLFLPGYATSIQAGKWKVLPAWPALSPLATQAYGSESAGSVFFIPQEAKNKDLARLFLNKLVLDKKGSLAQFKANSLTPLLRSVQPALLDYVNTASKPSSMTDELWAQQPQNFFGKDFYPAEFASYDHVKIFDYDPAATKEFAILNQWLIQVVQGKSDVTAALAGAQHDLETQIGNPYKS